MTSTTTTMTATAHFIARAPGLNLPPEVHDAALKCLVDWCGVAIGAREEGAQDAARRVVAGWGSTGRARILLGGTAAPAAAALVNGTMAHCLDYDDTHVGAVAHMSGPTWAAALALGSHLGHDETRILQAFVAGFETGARLGRGAGHALNKRGWHSTGVFGCLGAAAAAAVLLELDETQTAMALGAAATQTGGITASFGTMSKPFHAGKAAFNGILAAELAAEGFVANPDLLEAEGGMLEAMVQDGTARLGQPDFDAGWELLHNTFKPYASCLLTHPVIDAARRLAEGGDAEKIEGIAVDVSAACLQLAGKPAPTTPLEGKFSTAYCAALGLTGRLATESDFSTGNLGDPRIRDLVERTELRTAEGRDMRSARITLRLADGGERVAETELALGNPGNPMGWDDLRAKFDALVEPSFGPRTGELFDCLADFTRPGQAARLDGLLAGQ